MSDTTPQPGPVSPEPPVASPSLSDPRTVLPAAGASTRAPVGRGAHSAPSRVGPGGLIFRKILVAGLSGITVSGVLWIAGIAGLDLPEGWAGLIASGAATLAGYLTPESQ